MLESLTSNVFEYKKLSPEEQKQRGILGRLTGIIADFKNPTRNGRIYSESLWDHVFSDPIMQEKIKNRCVFGELGHPTDREEIDMEKIALCLAEQPKKGKDGKLYGVFDIMDTPNGRILKSLCDYGCNVGVSSRGSGDTFINSEGQDEVDESSYECQCWDAVLVPAVESARMNYVTESLNKKRYNKTLKESLEKVINNSSEDDKKVMKESLDTLGIPLNESPTGDLRSICKDAISFFKESEWPIKPNDWGGETSWDDVLAGIDFGTFELAEVADGIEEIVAPYLKSTYDTYDRMKKHYEQAGKGDLFDFSIYDDPEIKILEDILKDIRYYRDKYAKYFTEKYEGLNEDWAHDKYDALMDKGKDNWDQDDWEAYHYIMQTWADYGYFDESLNGTSHPSEFLKRDAKLYLENPMHAARWSDAYTKEVKDYIAEVGKENITDESLDNKESFAVDNNEAMVEELQNTLKQKQELENQVASLQEELSVCRAKENKLNEEIGRHKTTIIKLTENMTKVRALKSKIEVLNNEKTTLQEQLEKKSKELVKTKVDISRKQKSLDESYEAKKEKVNKLLETLRKDNQDLKNTNKELETKFDALNESVDDLKKDYELRTSDLSGKLEKSNKLVEKYNKIAKKAVDKYISEKATHIGVSTNEIVNRLPESYNFDDIDSICEELRSYKLNLSRLPFSTLNEGKGLKLKATSEKDPIFLKENYENDVDEQLLKLAKLK